MKEVIYKMNIKAVKLSVVLLLIFSFSISLLFTGCVANFKKDSKNESKKETTQTVYCNNCGEPSNEVTKYCPKCGEETEVYSRITGYYRPVKNWNDGKAQEYKKRKLYDVKNSKLKEEQCEDQVLLFGTKTCPNCKMAKTLLEKAKVDYKFVDAEENVDMTKKYNVKQAPTLVIVHGEEVNNIVNLSNIKKHIEEFKI